MSHTERNDYVPSVETSSLLVSAKASEPDHDVAPPELFKIHKGYEWAHIFIDESTGTFSAVSSFGNFAHIWRHRGGETLKEFVRDLDYDYFFGKTAHSKGQVFSAEETSTFAKQQILEYRRQAYWSKEDCREAWNDLLEMDDSEQDSRTYFEQFTGSGAIMKLFGDSYWEMGCQKRDPQCEGFWTEIWPEFLATLRSVSDEHSQSENPQGSSAEHASAVGNAETPIPSLSSLLTTLTETKKERDAALVRAHQRNEESEAYFRSLEQKINAWQDRSEALQAENEALKIEKRALDEIVQQDGRHIATLTKRIEEYERGLEPLSERLTAVAWACARIGMSEVWARDEASHKSDLLEMRDCLEHHNKELRALLNTKGESE